jgi:uncharacterized protein YabN with tetrapyrrole methylase and pyrophosphatase domain
MWNRQKPSLNKLIKACREKNIALSPRLERERKRQNKRSRERWRKKKRAERRRQNNSYVQLLKKALQSISNCIQKLSSNTTAVSYQEPESEQNVECKSQSNDYFINYLTTALTTCYHFALAYQWW